MSDDELLDVAKVMSAAGIEPVAGLEATLLAGGRSNLTYRLDDGETSWVLRMPPRSGRTPSAHDVAREYRVTKALAGSEVPVARPFLLCDNESVLGAPFTVVEYVPGVTVRTAADLDELDGHAVGTVTRRLVETLAALHRVDPESVGLAGYGRPDGYAARQLRRWTGQWELVGAPDHGVAATELSRRLSSHTPAQGGTSIVHGDYRIDNVLLTLVDDDPEVAAVVDWELSTLGDPVADVAMMCAYRDPVFDLIVGAPSAWTSARIPGIAELTQAYTAAGGVPLRDWEFHLALAYFKIAVIAAGIAHRAHVGAATGPGFDTAGEAVGTYLDLGLHTFDGGAR
ncbi:phosphotransferase [Amycolatopsis sp. RM579]|uniref:Phosphotransferase n=1 Tax=Amycolatopsis pithecellobii TaxID=664692 RepID=A0A6N7Z1G1_9PSEU|nr:phosphotransferase [Amycolatopsis pithecellobii]